MQNNPRSMFQSKTLNVPTPTPRLEKKYPAGIRTGCLVVLKPVRNPYTTVAILKTVQFYR